MIALVGSISFSKNTIVSMYFVAKRVMGLILSDSHGLMNRL